METACEAFGVEHGKQHAARHGEITEEYIDYNRRDVLATSELAVKLLEEYTNIRSRFRPQKHIRQPQSERRTCEGWKSSRSWSGSRISQGISRICPVRIFRRANQRAYSKDPGSGRLYRFPFDVSHGKQPHGSVAIRHCARNQGRRTLPRQILSIPGKLYPLGSFNPETWKHLTGIRSDHSRRRYFAIASKYSIGKQ